MANINLNLSSSQAWKWAVLLIMTEEVIKTISTRETTKVVRLLLAPTSLDGVIQLIDASQRSNHRPYQPPKIQIWLLLWRSKTNWAHNNSTGSTKCFSKETRRSQPQSLLSRSLGTPKTSPIPSKDSTTRHLGSNELQSQQSKIQTWWLYSRSKTNWARSNSTGSTKCLPKVTKRSRPHSLPSKSLRTHKISQIRFRDFTTRHLEQNELEGYLYNARLRAYCYELS